MAGYLDDEMRRELTAILADLPETIHLVYFTQEHACPACREQERLLREIATLSNRITLDVYDFLKDGDRAARLHINKIPATAVIGRKDFGIRFYGLTSGYEFSSLVEAVVMVSRGRAELPAEFQKLLAEIDEPVHLQVMTTLTCPYCPTAVHAAHRLAVASDMIRADMVDAGEFPHLAQRYNVSGVPKTIINEVHSFEGALTVEGVFLEVLKAVKPGAFQRLQDQIREARGMRHVITAEPEHTYEVIIAGGGPAAMSAAIYAARKDLDVLVLAKEIGGQVGYTAQIDNYLGLPDIGGKEMIEIFREHMERYPVAEGLGERIVSIEREKNRFVVTTEGEKKYRGNSVVYCAGKEYRRLGIPREENFIGKGIAFCATCDAPLYRGKRVAVVGGGNSAFTAVRDLTGFATEVHLIHRREEFTADPALVREVGEAANVVFHTGTQVREILGDRRFEGVRLISNDGKIREDLRVDGMFLEVGLIPNTSPVEGLIGLNERGEIPVTPTNATSLPGFFAAGDCTDVFEKQIVIAAGDGAKAALSAHSYLLDHKLTRSHAGVKDAWE